jgi:hypothetical protein
MAERYENTKILGLDLTPPPQSLFNNLQFEVDDFTQEWIPHDHDGFDLVHIRLLVGAAQDWPSVYSKAFEYVVPIRKTIPVILPAATDGLFTLPNS